MIVSHPRPVVRLRRLLRQMLLCASLVGALISLSRTGTPVHSQSEVAPAARPDEVHAPIDSKLIDYFLPGTQPLGLDEDLGANCNSCHVTHILTDYAGSMMANSARDPLFRAALRIANEDADFGGEFCIRCHVPNAWLNGRSVPPDGSLIKSEDLRGISCNTCHRMVPQYGINGESTRDKPERDYIKNLLGPLIIGSGAYVIDREEYRRGPYDPAEAINSHKAIQSSYLRTSLMCATCHEIDNPLLSKDPVTNEFVLNENGKTAPAGALFPIERTYSEWESSAFNTPDGVTGLSDLYPGIKRKDNSEDGAISVCQDCHMPLLQSRLVDDASKPLRQVGWHEWAGGSARWQDAIVDFWDGVDSTLNKDATLASKTLGEEMLARAADMELVFKDKQLTITVINNTGHKLPTGYAEGRRMWLQVTAYDASNNVISTIGAADADGEITDSPKVYEIKLGMSEDHAAAIARPELAGEGFHFILNNKVFKDNRIPPRGWKNVQYESKNMQPVGVIYADGQFTDTTTFDVPEGTTDVEVTLWYQTASPEYLDFLETEASEAVGDAVVPGDVKWGQVVGEMRGKFNLDQPVMMLRHNTSVPDLAIDKAVAPTGNLLPGQPVVYTINFSNPGAVTFFDVEIADTLSSLLTDVTFTSDVDPGLDLNQTGNPPALSWILPQLDAPKEGTITINATVSPQISADTVISNSVAMTGAEGNNQVIRTAQVSSNVVVPRIQLDPASYSVDEDAGSVQLTVKLDKANPHMATAFTLSTTDFSADIDEDYTAPVGPFAIAAGSTTTTVNVPILNDDIAETPEVFSVVLTGATGAALGNVNTANITIVSEDTGPVVVDDNTYLPSAENEE